MLVTSYVTRLVSSQCSVAALLRNRHTIAIGTQIREWFGAPHNAWFTGKVTKVPTVRSPGYDVYYTQDKSTIPQDEQEVRNIIQLVETVPLRNMLGFLCHGRYFNYRKSSVTDVYILRNGACPHDSRFLNARD